MRIVISIILLLVSMPLLAAGGMTDREHLTESDKQQLTAALALAPPDSRVKFTWLEDRMRLEGSVANKAEVQAFASRLLKANVFGQELLYLSATENGAFRIEIGHAPNSTETP